MSDTYERRGRLHSYYTKSQPTFHLCAQCFVFRNPENHLLSEQYLSTHKSKTQPACSLSNIYRESNT